MLSSSSSSYLTAPLTCSLSVTGTDTSANRAIASLLALDSEPPPKKSKSAGLTKFPSESNSTIEPLSLLRSKASSLY